MLPFRYITEPVDDKLVHSEAHPEACVAIRGAPDATEAQDQERYLLLKPLAGQLLPFISEGLEATRQAERVLVVAVFDGLTGQKPAGERKVYLHPVQNASMYTY